MDRKLAIFTVVSLVGLAMLFVFRTQLPSPANQPAAKSTQSNVADIERIQLLAEESCTCERNGGADCDKAYQTAVAGHLAEGVATACAPISASFDDVTFGGKTYPILRKYEVVASLPKGMSHTLCRKADAQAAEAAYFNAFGPEPDWSKPVDEAAWKARGDAANRAMTKVIREIDGGKKMAPVNNSKGCA